MYFNIKNYLKNNHTVKQILFPILLKQILFPILLSSDQKKLNVKIRSVILQITVEVFFFNLYFYSYFTLNLFFY